MVSWIINHAVEIFAAIYALEKAATIIVKLTPTPKDDTILAVVHKWIEKAASFLVKK